SSAAKALNVPGPTKISETVLSDNWYAASALAKELVAPEAPSAKCVHRGVISNSSATARMTIIVAGTSNARARLHERGRAAASSLIVAVAGAVLTSRLCHA